MRSDLTELVCIVDRSGSMSNTKEAAEEGFNSFIEAQKKDPGETRLTLVQFNQQYEKMYDNLDIRSSSLRYVLYPSGGTALYSAIKRTVREVGERLASTHEDLRPSKVIVVIVTDGEENSSANSTWEPVMDYKEIADIISHQRDKYSWQFVFLAANQDAMARASDIGIKRGSAMTFAANDIGTRNSYQAAAQNVSRYKTMNIADYEREVKTSANFFTKSDRDAQTAAGVDPSLNTVKP